MSTDAGALRIVIADDHAVVREGIRQVLCGDPADGFEVVGEAANGEEALALTRQLRPDVVIMDLTMPVMSGLEAVKQLCGSEFRPKILVLSIHDRDEYVLESIRAGAQGYLRKDSSPAELRAAVRAVHQGGYDVDAVAGPGTTGDVPEASSPRRKLDRLTARERDVLVAIARGRTNKEIAAQLGISVRTVESHRETLMRKLDLRGAAALTRFAVDCGIA